MEAERMGMIYKVFPDEVFAEESRKCRYIVPNAHQRISLYKKILSLSFTNTFGQQLQQEDVIQQQQQIQ